MADSPQLPLKLKPSLLDGIVIDVFIILFAIFFPLEILTLILFFAIIMSLISKAYILIFRRKKLRKSDLSWIRIGTPACIIITMIFGIFFLKR